MSDSTPTPREPDTVQSGPAEPGHVEVQASQTLEGKAELKPRTILGVRPVAWWAAAAVAIALGVGASSYRMVEVTQPATYSAAEGSGSSATLTVEGQPVAITVTASGPVERAKVPFFHPVDGAQLWGVRFHVDADPAVPLLGCMARLVDEQGIAYNYREHHLGAEGVDLPLGDATACVPGETPGPATTDEGLGLSPRPQDYDAMLIFALPEGKTPTRLEMGFAPPHYASLTLPEPTDVLRAP